MVVKNRKGLHFYQQPLQIHIILLIGSDTKGHTRSSNRGLYNFRPSIRSIPMDIPLFKIFPWWFIYWFLPFLKHIEQVASEHITHREEDA